jgi:hypothetical protein
MITIHLEIIEGKDGVCIAKGGDKQRKGRFFMKKKKKISNTNIRFNIAFLKLHKYGIQKIHIRRMFESISETKEITFLVT